MWCPTCDESRRDHPSGVCTTCGDGLLAQRPAATRNERRQQQTPAGTPEDMLSAILGDAIRRSQAGEGGGGGTQGVIDAAALIATANANDNFTGNTNDEDEWERPPEEAMDPTAGGMALPRNRPTSKDVVARMPRIKVDVNSSVLHEAAVECVPPPPSSSPATSLSQGSGSEGAGCSSVLNRRGARVSTSDAVVAEFGPPPPYSIAGRLVLADPITGSGGLSPACTSLLGNGGAKTIAYFERGGNVTFARKALLAQSAGASAVIVGNNVGVWPYVMKDGKNESQIEKLRIPVVMVKRSDGALLKRVVEQNFGGAVRCTVRSRKRNDNDHGGGCVVCREMFAIGDTVVRLPLCSHCFHERCALAWLGRHNTCPYCRRELPTDDEEYEAERRGRGRTHAGSSGGENDASSSGSAGRNWEVIFG